MPLLACKRQSQRPGLSQFTSTACWPRLSVPSPTLTRRLRERQREAELPDLLDCLDADFPPESITWILPDVPHLYGQVLALIRSSAGELNFNDGLIALTCRERGVRALASFDEDFDSLPWLTRVSAFADVKMVLTAGDQPESNTDE